MPGSLDSFLASLYLKFIASHSVSSRYTLFRGGRSSVLHGRQCSVIFSVVANHIDADNQRGVNTCVSVNEQCYAEFDTHKPRANKARSPTQGTGKWRD